MADSGGPHKTPKVSTKMSTKGMSKMELFYQSSSEDEGPKKLTSRYNLRQNRSRDPSSHSEMSCGSDVETERQSIKPSAGSQGEVVKVLKSTRARTRKNKSLSLLIGENDSLSQSTDVFEKDKNPPSEKEQTSGNLKRKSTPSKVNKSSDLNIHKFPKKQRKSKSSKPSLETQITPAVSLRQNQRGGLVAFDYSELTSNNNALSTNTRRGFIPALNATPTNLWNTNQATKVQILKNSTNSLSDLSEPSNFRSLSPQPSSLESTSSQLLSQPSSNDQTLIIVNNCIYKFEGVIPSEVSNISEPFYVEASGKMIQANSLSVSSVKLEEIFQVPTKLSAFYSLHGFYFGHKKVTSDKNKKIQKKGYEDLEISASFYVYCRLCKKLKSYNGGVAANFGRHLKDIHKLVNPSSLNLGVISLDEKGLVSYSQAERYDRDHARQITGLDLLLQYFMDCNLPFQNIEKFSLKRLLNFFDPHFILPSKQTMASLLTQKVESEVKESLMETLKKVDSATLIVDAWSTKSMQGVLAISIVFLDENFDWKRKTISISRIFGSHTSENISRIILSVISKWSLKDKIHFICSDGGANMVRSLNDLHDIALNEEWGQSSSTSAVEQSVPSLATNEGSSTNLAPNCSNTVTIGEVPEILGFSTDFVLEGDNNLSKEILSDSDIIRIEELSDIISFLYEEIMKPLKCLAHTLQRVLADGAKYVKAARIHKTVKKTSAFGRKRQVAREITKAMTGKVLKRPCTTRWNSVVDSGWTLWEPNLFDLMSNLIDEAREKASAKVLEHLPDPLTQEFYEELHEFLLVSDPICKLTDEVQGDGITSHLVIPGIARAHEAIRNLTGLKHMEEYRQIILKSFETRMEPFLNDKEFIFATVLSPCYKLSFFELYFDDNSTENANVLGMPSLDTIKELCHTHLITAEEMESSFSRPPSSSETSTMSNCSYAQRIQERENKKIEKKEATESDFKKYIDQKPVLESPLEFWKRMKGILPRLYKKAREVFCKPATSGLIERLFSLLADINTADRANLNVKTMEEIVMYKEFIDIPRTYKEATANIFHADGEELAKLVQKLGISKS